MIQLGLIRFHIYRVSAHAVVDSRYHCLPAAVLTNAVSPFLADEYSFHELYAVSP